MGVNGVNVLNSELFFEAKQTVPAPAQFLAELFRGKNAENTR